MYLTNQEMNEEFKKIKAHAKENGWTIKTTGYSTKETSWSESRGYQESWKTEYELRDENGTLIEEGSKRSMLDIYDAYLQQRQNEEVG